MAGSLRGWLLVGCLFATVTGSAHSFGGRWCPVPGYRVVYYPAYPAPMVWCPPGLPAPPPVPYPFAQPYPAPPSPSPTREPPWQSPLERAPKVSESRSLSSSKPLPVNPKAGPTCRVGFWNTTGRDVTLKIDGTSYLLAKDKSLTLDLGRKFTWHMERGEPRGEIVPDDRATWEIVLRSEGSKKQ